MKSLLRPVMKARLVALSFCLIFTLTVGAQVKLGIKGGLDVTDLKFKSEVFNAENRKGWFFGPTLKFTIPIVGLGMDISALYNHRETTLTDVYADVDDSEQSPFPMRREFGVKHLKTRQVMVPLNARYTLGLADTFNLFAYAGPQVAFRLGDESETLSEYEDDVLVWRMRDSNFSVNVGAGVTVFNLQLTANYNVALGRTGDVTLRDATDAVVDGFRGNYNSWQLSATWFF